MAGIIVTDMKRALLSKRLIFGALGIVLARLCGSSTLLMGDVVQTCFYNVNLNELIFMLPGIPYLNGLVEDLNSGLFMPEVIRCGVNKYAFSKIIVTVLAALICSFLGNMLYVIVLMCVGPLMGPLDTSNYYVFSSYFLGNYVLQSKPILFLIGRWICLAFVLINVIMISICFSSICPKKLLVYASPIIVYYLFAFVLWRFGAPAWMLPARQVCGNMTENYAHDLLIYLSETCAVCAGFGALFIMRLRRLVKNARC